MRSVSPAIGWTMRVDLRWKLAINLIIFCASLYGAVRFLLDSSAKNDWGGYVLASIGLAALVSFLVLFVRVKPRRKEFMANVQARWRAFCVFCGLAALLVPLGVPALGAVCMAAMCGIGICIDAIPADL